MSLTIENYINYNVLRNSFYKPCLDWSATDWACALAGEVGEACNLVKKRRRGDSIDPKEIGKELADVVCYTILLANHIGIDLEQSLIEKFNDVSNRIGSHVFIKQKDQ
jgi:NTP pyrophosphatase (non-canonical NTP hydrolase)